MPSDDVRTRAVEHARVVLGTDPDPATARVMYLDRVTPAALARLERDQGLDATENAVYERFKRRQDVIAAPDPDALPDGFVVLAAEVTNSE